MIQPVQLWMHNKHQHQGPVSLEMVDATTVQRHINKYILKKKCFSSQIGRNVQISC